MNIVQAGVLYFAVVFSIAFGLGTIRELALRPFMGPGGAALAELPMLLVVMLMAARWLIERYSVPPTLLPRMMMGGVGLVLVILGDGFVGLYLRQYDLRELIHHYGTPGEIVLLILYLLFSAIPIVLIRWDRSQDRST